MKLIRLRIVMMLQLHAYDSRHTEHADVFPWTSSNPDMRRGRCSVPTACGAGEETYERYLIIVPPTRHTIHGQKESTASWPVGGYHVHSAVIALARNVAWVNPQTHQWRNEPCNAHALNRTSQ